MFGIGAWELTIIFAIVLVLFGGKRLPSVATGLGEAIRNFKTALKGDVSESSPQLLDNHTNRVDDKNA